jgi:hypothetical protein
MTYDVTAFGALPPLHRLAGQQFVHLLRGIWPHDGAGILARASGWWTRACVTMGMGMLVLLHVAKAARGFLATGRMINPIDDAWTDKLLSAGRV